MDHPPCKKCGKPVTDSGLQVEGAIFHAACFTCDKCSKVISGPYHIADGSRFCEACAPQTTCAKCGQAVHLQAKRVDGKCYHPQCFTCDSCDVPLGTFYPHGGKRLCENCVPKLYCAKCKGVITDQAMRLDDDIAFHPECFSCVTCKKVLTDTYLLGDGRQLFCSDACVQKAPGPQDQQPQVPGSQDQQPQAAAPQDQQPQAPPTTSAPSAPLIPSAPSAPVSSPPADGQGSTKSSGPVSDSSTPQNPPTTALPTDGGVRRGRADSTTLKPGSALAQDVPVASTVAGPMQWNMLSALNSWTTNLTSGLQDTQAKIKEDASKLASNLADSGAEIAFVAGGKRVGSARRIFDLIDYDQSGEISKLKLLKAVSKSMEVSKYILGRDAKCSSVLDDDEDGFDEVCVAFERISQGIPRVEFQDFAAYFGEVSIRQRCDTAVLTIARRQRRILIIGPGFGAKLNPRQTALVESAGYQLHWVHVPNPEVPTFPIMQYLPEIQKNIQMFQPELIAGASKGGVYLTAMWQTGMWVGPTLLLNAHPTCTRLPPNTSVVIAHGANDEVYQRPRAQLEELLLTGSPNKCFLYYTANSGQMPDGRFTRFGDMHNMESILHYNCLPRLIDAALSDTGPEMFMLESWANQLINDRLVAEQKLGYTPELLQRFWASSKKQGMDRQKLFEVPVDSEEFQHISTIFKAQSKDPPMYGGFSEAWKKVRIARIERIENGLQNQGNSKPHFEALRASLEEQGLQFQPGLHTRWGFHGTQAVESIVSNPMQGFQPLVASRQVWGSGTYFARDAKYASDGGFCLNTQQGRVVLMCLLMTGMPCLGDPLHRGVLPFRVKPHRYNSSVDSVSNPEIHIVQHSAAALPAYVITFVPSLG